MKLVVMVAIVTILAMLAVAQVQKIFLVFDSGCIEELTRGPETRIEVPVIDGKPDYKHGILYKPLTKVNKACGHYEVRK